MRIIFKIFAVPIMLILTVVVAVFKALLHVGAWLLGIASGLIALLAAAMLFTGEYVGGGVYMALAFLVSPFGLPTVGAWLLAHLQIVNYSLRYFIMSCQLRVKLARSIEHEERRPDLGRRSSCIHPARPILVSVYHIPKSFTLRRR